MHDLRIVIVMVSVALVCAANAYAFETTPNTGLYFEDDRVLRGGLLATYEWDDNFFRENEREDTASGLVLEPQFDLNGRIYGLGRRQYHLKYRGKTSVYDERRDLDDYFDNDALLRLGIFDRRKFKLTTDLIHLDRHDPRGVERSDQANVDLDRPIDRWYSSQLFFDVDYGAPTAEGRLHVRGGLFNKRYRNNREQTAFLNRQSRLLKARFIWRWRPKTRFTVHYNVEQVRFDAEESRSRNSTEQRALVGINWLASAKTSGRIQIGGRNRSFPNFGAERDFSSLTWDVAVRWYPKSYSKFVLSAERDSAESFLRTASFIDSKSIGLNWTHDWSFHWQTRFEIRGVDFEFVNDSNQRNDSAMLYSADLRYRLNEHVEVRASWEHSVRSSTISERNFDRNVLNVGLNLEL